MKNRIIRTLIVDDHRMVREALSEVLGKEPDIDIVGESGDGKAAMTQCHDLQPDVILMDVALPDISGIEVTRRILAETSNKARVLAMSTYMDLRYVFGMLKAGAIGYVSKAAGKDELLRGIRSAARRECYLSANVAALLAQGEREKVTKGLTGQLGKRETEVLSLIANGQTSAEIAVRLHIATGTVDVHRRNIMRKLQLHNAADLTKYAIREGLVSA